MGGKDTKVIEIKSGRTINIDYFSGINYWNTLAGKGPYSSYIIYGGDKSQKRFVAGIVGYKHITKIFNK